MKRTPPSQNRKLAPPGWLLLAFWYCPAVELFDVTAPSEHQPNGYWVELGGTIVLNTPKLGSFCAHRIPLMLVAALVAGIRKAAAQFWRSVKTPAEFVDASW